MMIFNKKIFNASFLLLLYALLSACASSPASLAEEGDLNGVRALLSKTSNINARYKNYGGLTLLGAAAKGGQIQVIDELLARGADIENGGTHYLMETPLMQAVGARKSPAVKHLLAKGANIHATNSKGETVLHVAAVWGSATMVRLLLANGIDLLAKDKQGENAAHEAASRGEKALLALIKEARSRDAYNAKTTAEKRPVIRYQLVNAKTLSGKTPLHISAGSHHGLDETRMLLQAGANPNVTTTTTLWDRHRSVSGVTPLHKAADADNKKTMNLLLRYGANRNAVTSSGETVRSIHNNSPFKSSGFDFGKVIAIAGGAALASSSGMNSIQQTEFMTNYTKDVLGDTGGENTRNWGNNGGSSSSDINDPLNPNNPINKRMNAQVKRNVGLHEQKQQQAKQEYAAQLKQRSQKTNQQRAASLRNSGFTSNSQQQAVSQQSGSSTSTKSKYSGMSFAAKDDKAEAKEPEKEKVETPPVAISKGQMFGDSEEYYYSKKSAMNIAQTHLQNNTAEFCGSSTKSKLTWSDGLTSCTEKNEQFRCKVYATATCFDKPCDTFFCGTKR